MWELQGSNWPVPRYAAWLRLHVMSRGGTNTVMYDDMYDMYDAKMTV